MTRKFTHMCETASADATKELAATLAAYLRPGHVIVLTGDLGAGKTQFSQGIARALGVKAAVVSPTFNIVISYEDGVLPLHHFDWYRLEEPAELDDIGFYEYAEGSGVTLVEWGDKFPEELPYSYLELAFFVSEDGVRRVCARAEGAEHEALLRLWADDAAARLKEAAF